MMFLFNLKIPICLLGMISAHIFPFLPFIFFFFFFFAENYIVMMFYLRMNFNTNIK